MNDFIECFVTDLNKLTLPYKPSLGILGDKGGISVSLLPGSRTISVFYDGTKEKIVNVEVAIKSKNQGQAYKALQTISAHVENLSLLPSKTGSFEFVQIINSSEPFHQMQDEHGDWILIFNTQAQIII